MHSGLTAHDHLCRLQQRQILEPEAGAFDLAVPELPGLDCLVWFSDSAADDRDWVLQRNPFDGCIEQKPDEVEGFSLLFLLEVKPACPTYSQVGAWRVRDHQVPLTVENLGNIALEMFTRSFCGQ